MILRYGSKGKEVYSLQILLNKSVNNKLHPTGYFDTETEIALKQLQTQAHVTGIVDTESLGSLKINTSGTVLRALDNITNYERDTIKFSSRKGVVVDRIIIQAGLQEDLDNTLFLWAECSEPLSCHFVIDYDGSITKVVPTDKAAWHSGALPSKELLDYCSIGIVLVNWGQLRKEKNSLMHWTKDTVYEREVYGHPVRKGLLYFTPYTTEQFSSLCLLIDTLKNVYTDIDEVCTRDDLEELGDNPGPGFAHEKLKDRFKKIEKIDISIIEHNI